MTDIKEIKLVDVKNNSNIINNLNSIYKLWGYEEVSPSFINTLETIKGRGVIEAVSYTHLTLPTIYSV